MTIEYNPRYTSGQISALFNISTETVRTWCQEFERHLSPRANPGHRQKRAFTDDDLEIFALIANFKSESLTFADIHAALDNGERGIPPLEVDLEDREKAVIQTIERNLTIKIGQLENQLLTSEAENTRLQHELQKYQHANIKHEVRVEMLHEQLAKAEERIRELLDQRIKLEREIGELQSDIKHNQKDKDA